MIPAKEKARELVDKYAKVYYDLEYDYNDDRDKQCTLISVEQIIDEYQSISDLESTLVVNGQVMSIVDKIVYWNEVKSEIDKL
jgi:hypothetical protein